MIWNPLPYLYNLIRRPTLEEVILYKLNEARRDKLEAEAGVDFAKSVVDYNAACIKRLEARISQQTETSKGLGNE
jgi:hypothetical protein